MYVCMMFRVGMIWKWSGVCVVCVCTFVVVCFYWFTLARMLACMIVVCVVCVYTFVVCMLCMLLYGCWKCDVYVF